MALNIKDFPTIVSDQVTAIQASSSSLISTTIGSIIRAVAEANAAAIRQVGASIAGPGGMESVNFKIAEQYVAAFEKLAKTGNTLIVPADLSNVSTLIASAMQTVKSQNVAR